MFNDNYLLLYYQPCFQVQSTHLIVFNVPSFVCFRFAWIWCNYLAYQFACQYFHAFLFPLPGIVWCYFKHWKHSVFHFGTNLTAPTYLQSYLVSTHLPTHPPIPTYPLTYKATDPLTYLPTHQYLSTHLNIYLLTCKATYPLTHPPTHQNLPTHLPIYPPTIPIKFYPLYLLACSPTYLPTYKPILTKNLKFKRPAYNVLNNCLRCDQTTCKKNFSTFWSKVLRLEVGGQKLLNFWRRALFSGWLVVLKTITYQI